jgi:hypothetical protein
MTMNKPLTAETFPHYQLALASVIANPKLGKLLGKVTDAGAMAGRDAEIVSLLSTAGFALDNEIKLTVEPPSAEGLSLTVCVDYDGVAHCTVITIRSPIVFE